MRKVLVFYVIFSIIVNYFIVPVSVDADAIDNIALSVNFTDGSVSSWTQAYTTYSASVAYATDASVGNYIRVSDNNAVNSIETGIVSPSFAAITDMAVMDFDIRSYGAGGIGNGVIGVKPVNGSNSDSVYAFGFRSHSSSKTPSIAYGVGNGKYTAVSNAPTSKHDTWYHYTVIFDFVNSKTNFIITDRSTGTSYTNEISGVTVTQMTAVEIFLSQPTNYCQTGFAVDVANLQIYRPNPTNIALSAKNDITEQYIGSNDINIQYTAVALHNITYKTVSGTVDNTATGSFKISSNIAFSIANENGEDIAVTGLTVDSSGLVTISPTASEGTYYIKASGSTASKMLPLTLKVAKDADSVQIDGSEVVKISDTANTYQYKAIPKYEGTVIPERATTWSIISKSDNGATIDSVTGVLTVPPTATAGKITIQALLNAEGSQVTENVLDTFDVTIQGSSAIEPISVGGIFLKNGIIELSSAESIVGVILAVKEIDLTDTYNLILKSYDKNNYLANEGSFSIDSSSIEVGVQCFYLNFDLDEASYVKAYISNSAGLVISTDVKVFTSGSYKNIPLVSDWITGAKSGLGMGAGVISPTTVPTGIDPSIVKTSTSNVTYTYDSNYPKITSDNMLWYKTGAYNASSTIYDRDGAVSYT
ncbi:MAG: hypothetical protein N2171_08395, partial [Clostridia bacterium]|nr:hypothetical protein [Clostridia bacterium]